MKIYFYQNIKEFLLISINSVVCFVVVFFCVFFFFIYLHPYYYYIHIINLLNKLVVFHHLFTLNFVSR